MGLPVDAGRGGQRPEQPDHESLTFSSGALAESKSRMLFPLRTGVELFRDPTMPEAVARAKQAAALYDELIFEMGLCEVTVTPAGSMEEWRPPHLLTDEELAESRRVPEAGTSISLSVGQKGPEGWWAELMAGPVGTAYASEYHTGILDELALFEPDWVKRLDGGPLTEGTPERGLAEALRKRDTADGGLMRSMRGGDELALRNWIIKAFDRDVTVARAVGASLSATSLFSPMIEARGAKPERAGLDALEILVPDLASLSWEAVFEFRDHPGSAEARAMLREFEEKAASQEPEDAHSYLRSVQDRVHDALFAAIEEKRAPLFESVATEAVKTGIGLIPVVGQIAGPAMSAVEVGSEFLRERRSWTAAMMVLRRR